MTVRTTPSTVHSRLETLAPLLALALFGVSEVRFGG
jgi:hypothetical protein